MISINRKETSPFISVTVWSVGLLMLYISGGYLYKAFSIELIKNISINPNSDEELFYYSMEIQLSRIGFLLIGFLTILTLIFRLHIYKKHYILLLILFGIIYHFGLMKLLIEFSDEFISLHMLQGNEFIQICGLALLISVIGICLILIPFVSIKHRKLKQHTTG